MKLHPRGESQFLVPPEPHSRSVTTHPGGFLKFITVVGRRCAFCPGWGDAAAGALQRAEPHTGDLPLPRGRRQSHLWSRQMEQPSQANPSKNAALREKAWGAK